jgi:hypothetical protein
MYAIETPVHSNTGGMPHLLVVPGYWRPDLLQPCVPTMVHVLPNRSSPFRFFPFFATFLPLPALSSPSRLSPGIDQLLLSYPSRTACSCTPGPFGWPNWEYSAPKKHSHCPQGAESGVQIHYYCCWCVHCSTFHSPDSELQQKQTVRERRPQGGNSALVLLPQGSHWREEERTVARRQKTLKRLGH